MMGISMPVIISMMGILHDHQYDGRLHDCRRDHGPLDGAPRMGTIMDTLPIMFYGM